MCLSRWSVLLNAFLILSFSLYLQTLTNYSSMHFLLAAYYLASSRFSINHFSYFTWFIKILRFFLALFDCNISPLLKLSPLLLHLLLSYQSKLTENTAHQFRFSSNENFFDLYLKSKTRTDLCNSLIISMELSALSARKNIIESRRVKFLVKLMIPKYFTTIFPISKALSI